MVDKLERWWLTRDAILRRTMIIFHRSYSPADDIPWKQRTTKQKIAKGIVNGVVWGLFTATIGLLIISCVGIVMTGGWAGACVIGGIAAALGIICWAISNEN